MAYLIGTDEAGYGPNLGPLVIAGTLWQVADDVVDEDLYQRMPDIGMPGAAAGGGRCRLLIGDSKMLYRSKAGLGRLEPGVLAAFHTSCGTEPHTMPIGWCAFIQHCDGSAVDALTSVPWYTGFDRPLPLAVSPSQIKGAHQLLLRALQGAGVTLLAIAARVVFPERFNAAVSACGSKGTALRSGRSSWWRATPAAGSRIDPGSVRQTRCAQSIRVVIAARVSRRLDRDTTRNEAPERVLFRAA